MKKILIIIFKILHIRSSVNGSKSNVEMTLNFIMFLCFIAFFVIVTPFLKVLGFVKDSNIFFLIQFLLLIVSFYIIYRYKPEIYNLYKKEDNPEMNFGAWNVLIKLLLLFTLIAVFVFSAVIVYHF